MDLSIVERSEDVNGIAILVVTGGDLYPAAVAEIKAVLASGKPPAKFLDTEGTLNPLRGYFDEAMKIGVSNFGLALVPYKDALGMSVEQRAVRASALEIARRWFTELLHQSLKAQPMRLKITTDEERTFKL